ncbi:hypothetical protein SDC9_196107 [bioreactor metagenome]|uniref:Gylcosyl hydrolase 115 C-terminal domain-containing protein n=1 Tax=bioreactor metagenome TaxID=1076179 RepID=A0A645IBI3_9ZZZZ
MLTDSRNTVVVVEYAGVLTDKYDQLPVTVSAQYRLNKLLPNDATREGAATIKSITHSDYFGNWKHTTCLTEMKKPEDVVHFNLRFTDPGDYKIMLSYNCEVENSRQEGVIEFNKQRYLFQTVRTGGKYTNKEPLMFHNHHIAIVTVTEPGVYSLKIYPLKEGKELFKLQSIQIDPLK